MQSGLGEVRRSNRRSSIFLLGRDNYLSDWLTSVAVEHGINGILFLSGIQAFVSFNQYGCRLVSPRLNQPRGQMGIEQRELSNGHIILGRLRVWQDRK